MADKCPTCKGAVEVKRVSNGFAMGNVYRSTATEQLEELKEELEESKEQARGFHQRIVEQKTALADKEREFHEQLEQQKREMSDLKKALKNHEREFKEAFEVGVNLQLELTAANAVVEEGKAVQTSTEIDALMEDPRYVGTRHCLRGLFDALDKLQGGDDGNMDCRNKRR